MGTRHESGERDQTDNSLRGERERTDDELTLRHEALADSADASVKDARKSADNRLRVARETTDEAAALDAPRQAEVVAEREREDRALAEGRATVDRQLTQERTAYHRVIAELLSQERESTDSNLDVERRASDHEIDARDDFLGVVTHDLRDMLAGLTMNAAMIHDEAGARPDGATIARRAVSIQRFVTRMTRLVGDLLDVVSIEAGRLRVTTERLFVSSLLKETVDTFQAPAAARGIAIGTKLPDGALLATFDHDRILQVLGNLVGNAIKFTEPGGRIDVEVRARDDEVVFSVRDTGAGIAAEDLADVFERFHQVTPRNRLGLGLGLYISRCIVDAHGGRIWATSKLGEGSVFCFTLPRAL